MAPTPKALAKPFVRWIYGLGVRAGQQLPRFLAHGVELQAIRLGTEYGGWWVADDPDMQGGLVISAGAGEDVSFDIEVARRFDTAVLIVDPTPRAVHHVDAVLNRAVKAPSTSFVPGGHQPIDAYDLTGLRPGQVELVPNALWSHGDGIDLYPPADPAHVSYSATDFRSLGRRTSEPIRVMSTTLTDLVGMADRSASLLKLDIEGAEVEVIADMLRSGIRPPQVLVEFDELARPTWRHVVRAMRTVRSLGRAGYRLFHVEGLNYSFALTRGSRTGA